MMESKRLAASALSVLLAAGAAAGDVQLGGRYRDPLHGFSLRPPAGAQRREQASSSGLVTWSVRDPATGAIAWTLTVQEIPEEKAEIDLGQYAAALKAKMKAEASFDAERIDVGKIAEKPAFQLRGTTLGALRFWQRQAWVLAKPGRFLVFTVSGPGGSSKLLDARCEAILQTVRITDPEQFVETRRRNLARGQGLLERIADKDLAGTVEAAEQWWLMRHKGKIVGWRRQTEGPVRYKGADGFRVTSWAMAVFPGFPARLYRRELFATANRTLGQWREHLQVGDGDKAFVQTEEGLKTKDAIVIDTSRNGVVGTTNKRIPPNVQDVFLPKLFGALIYRLIDRSPLSEGAPRGYLFADFNAEKNQFDMRTVTVVGLERIQAGGAGALATRLVDQKHYTEPEADVWVDKKGRLLLMKVQEQEFLIEQATKQAVLKHYPKAPAVIRQLNRPVQKTSPPTPAPRPRS